MNWKIILGVSLMLFGVLLGLYIGVYLLFIGGIIQIVQSINPVVISTGIAIGLCKVLLSGFCGYISAYIPILLGLYIADN